MYLAIKYFTKVNKLIKVKSSLKFRLLYNQLKNDNVQDW